MHKSCNKSKISRDDFYEYIQTVSGNWITKLESRRCIKRPHMRIKVI